MTEQQQTPESQNSPASNPPPTRRDEWRDRRRADREAHWQERAERWQHRRGRSSLVWGGILILLGIVFYLQNAGFLIAFNWWAVFILIPAFWSFIGAWDSFREQRRLTRRAAGAMVGGTLLTVLAVMFLFNMGFTPLWPLLLIVGGAALILTGFVPV
jgi:UDP-N-acetylmuramyl pentapeptide phosphotransferase/UDP-N-acetylglucosamine-1-phosphate transferase